MTFPEPKDPRSGIAEQHRKNALTGKTQISNAEIVTKVQLTPDNYDRATLKEVWNHILEAHGWEITDINDGDYSEMIITLESQDASGLATTEDMEYNTDLIKELKGTGAFQEVLININDTAYISLHCILHPEL